MMVKLALGAAALGLIYYAVTKAAGAASAAGDAIGAAAAATDNAIADTVTGAGAMVGIPTTDENACAQLLRDGFTWQASFKCKASTFISYLAGNNPQQDYTWQAHGAR